MAQKPPIFLLPVKEFTLYVSCSYWRNIGITTKLFKGTLIEVAGIMYIRTYASADGEP